METGIPSQDQRKARTYQTLGSERGAALLLVLWIGTFFTIILSSFAFSMRTELVAAKNFKEREEARSLAMAGVTRAIAEMLNDMVSEAQRAPTFRLYNPVRVSLGKGVYEVMVTDAESRIALNSATPAMLKTLLRNTGVTDLRLADAIVDSILDWRDPDDVRRINGAEEEHYRSLSPPYLPRNGPFEMLEELLLVSGMTREILYGNVEDAERLAWLRSLNPTERTFGPREYLGIYPYLSVHGSASINLNTASLDVLVAAGLTYEKAQAIVHARSEDALENERAQLPRGNRWTTGARTFRIESVARINNSNALHRVVATVINAGGSGKPRFKVVGWYEGLG